METQQEQPPLDPSSSSSSSDEDITVRRNKKSGKRHTVSSMKKKSKYSSFVENAIPQEPFPSHFSDAVPLLTSGAYSKPAAALAREMSETSTLLAHNYAIEVDDALSKSRPSNSERASRLGLKALSLPDGVDRRYGLSTALATASSVSIDKVSRIVDCLLPIDEIPQDLLETASRVLQDEDEDSVVFQLADALTHSLTSVFSAVTLAASSIFTENTTKLKDALDQVASNSSKAGNNPETHMEKVLSSLPLKVSKDEEVVVSGTSLSVERPLNEAKTVRAQAATAATAKQATADLLSRIPNAKTNAQSQGGPRGKRNNPKKNQKNKAQSQDSQSQEIVDDA
ncbi:MAG: hypothetical protein GY721_07005 [Deltaproteobacteria bacterium]|nr:hypothetical protein [Deltaproteobacteria bacterium]